MAIKKLDGTVLLTLEGDTLSGANLSGATTGMSLNVSVSAVPVAPVIGSAGITCSHYVVDPHAPVWFDESGKPTAAASPRTDLFEVATRKVSRLFGLSAQVVREPFVDPETGSRQTFIVVETALPFEQGQDLLRQLEDEWWLEAMPVDGSVALELRYV